MYQAFQSFQSITTDMAENNDNYKIVPNKKAKSEIWSHFGLKFDIEKKTFVNGIAVCKLCNGTVKYSGGTTNLNTHIDRHHPTVVKSKQGYEFFRTDPEVKKQKTFHGMHRAKYEFSSDRAVAITRSIGRYIIDDLRDFSVVEETSFVNMIKTLDPYYRIPSNTYFSQTLIPTMYEETVAEVRSILSLAKTVALTADKWTSQTAKSYVTITSVHISSDWKLHKFVLQTTALPESYCGRDITDIINEAQAEWMIPTFNPSLVTDTSAEMIAAGKELCSKHHIGCLAHTLNLAAQKALNINSVSRILSRVRKIASLFHRNNAASAVLKSQATLYGLKEVKLLCDVPTRWNSSVEMLERYMHLQPAIRATLLASDITTSSESGINPLNETFESMLAHEIMACLVPLRDIIEAICAEKMLTVSAILPLIQRVKKIMAYNERDSSTVRSMKDAVTDILETRYEDEELGNFLEECTVLDPRFKDRYFEPAKLHAIYDRLSWQLQTDEDHVQIKVEVEEEPSTTLQQHTPEDSQWSSSTDQPSTSMSTNTSESDVQIYPDQKPCMKNVGLASIFDDVVVKDDKTVFDKVDEEINKYKLTPQISVQSDPLVWWRDNCVYFPLLAPLVQTRLCIPAASVPAGRVFTAAGDIVSSQRACLSHDLVDTMIFLKENSM